MNIRIQLIVMLLFYLGSTYVLGNCYGQTTSASSSTGSDSNLPDSNPHPSKAQPASAPATGKTIVGKASWYGPGFKGHKTASGETFDPKKSTAAAKQLPLGSHAVVTNLDNGQSVKVKVNDCGPVPKDRKIDLSKKAAQKLDMTRKGTAPVKIKVVDTPPGATACDDK